MIEKINDYIKQLNYNDVTNLYEPIRYVLALGGKRIRPQLMLIAYKLFKNDVESILPQAVALEIYHNFTLLHDDLMDRADMRRGRPTVHKKWNDNTAILSGDAMLILAYQQFSLNIKDNSNFAKALQTFNEATLGVCEGQQYDIDFESKTDVSENDYMEMIRLKTSLLLACALKIGAQLAGADDKNADLLYKFGEKIGQAFQLQDDLLDVYGDPAVFGKKLGGDIVCNKKTYMLINALQITKGDTHDTLVSWINKTDFNSEEKIQIVKNIYNEINIQKLCEEKIQDLFTEALFHLQNINVPEERKQPLVDFANTLLSRKY